VIALGNLLKAWFGRAFMHDIFKEHVVGANPVPGVLVELSVHNQPFFCLTVPGYADDLVFAAAIVAKSA
jgi:hypothetical protein